MAFDAGMMRAVIREIERETSDGKVEKIYQPERDEIVFIIRARGAEKRLLINAGSSCPRMNLTSAKAENPSVPPMFCMMLRKHFTGARIDSLSQPGFERIARITFECRDDMGFKTKKHLIVEIMGKYSNIIVTDERDKIIGILKPIDFAASTIRQLLPGMTYSAPPVQDKLEPTEVSREDFNRAAAAADPDTTAAKFISSTLRGFAAVTAREIVFRAVGDAAATLGEAGDRLYSALKEVTDAAEAGGVMPSLLRDESGMPREYSYVKLTQYGNDADVAVFDSASRLIDEYYMKRADEERLRRRAADIFRILANAESRLTKKIAIQREELDKCADGERFKRYGDLITGNIYQMKRGMDSVTLCDWYDDGKEVKIPLSSRLTPAQNAQAYYKKYNKSKSAKFHLTEQLSQAEQELEYIGTVFDALTRARCERELDELRSELYHSGYASKMKNYSEKKRQAPMISKFMTRDGHTVLCGRNNISNDHLTLKVASKDDWWFHVKDMPGSHVVLICLDGEKEPPEEAFTDAAMIAAYHSKAADGVNVPVDYTKVRQVKKPAGSRPGYVIYHTNFTAYVTPERDAVAAMEVKQR